VTFDPFRDFETRGYLRNFENEKDLAIVKRLEHASFLTGIDDAFAALARRKELGYGDVLQTHKILFDAVYPWAGQDRMETAPLLTIKKGPVIFANPSEIRTAVEYGLRLGQDISTMIARPGEVMGYLAFGHPFLDGNGRAIMTVHSIMAQRAGFSIDWSATNKTAYLDALTNELERPGKGILDDFLKRYIGSAISYDKLAAQVASTPGLDGSAEAQASEILGNSNEPAVKAQYEEMLHKRTRE
jgi:cell filamentation protein